MQTIKTFVISLVLFVPALSGMRAIEKNDESLPVDARHRGYTPMHVAAYLGNVAQISELLASEACPLSTAAHKNDSAGADDLVCAKSINGCTPLHVAAEQGQLRAVEVLIGRNQSLVNMQDTAGLTPLAYAATNGNTDVIRCLIAYGAKINLSNNRNHQPFQIAAQNGHLEAMKILQPAERSFSSKSLLMTFYLDTIRCAIESGKPEVLASLKQMIKERRTAETLGSRWYCRNWLGTWYDSELYDSERYNSREVTPLLLAASFGHVPLMQWSLEEDGARIDEIDMNGDCALHFASRHGHVNAVQFLLERNPELVKIKNVTRTSPGWTALHDAAESGHLEVIKLLLHFKAEVDAQDTMGQTPLLRAASNGHTQALQLLIDFEASPAIADEMGNTALHLAALHGHRACIEVLLAAGSDIEAKDLSGRTPLLCAAEAGHLAVIKCLLGHGADIKQQAITGNALMLAAMGDHFEVNHLEVMEFLLDNTEIELTSCCAQFPGTVPVIFSAAKMGHYKATNLLMKKGSFIDAQLADGRTALHCAIENLKPGVVRLLLRAGANMLCPDNAGVTPLDVLGYQVAAAKNYFQNRSLYLSGKLRPEDNLDSVFSMAADFLDIPVLEALKDQLGDRLIQWRDWTGEENLLIVAIKMNDFDCTDWLLDQKICDMSHKDSEKHDALWFALNSTRFKNRATRLALVTKLLEAGAVVTEGHLIDEASNCHFELLMRLLVTYRYKQRPAHERLSLFK